MSDNLPIPKKRLLEFDLMFAQAIKLCQCLEHDIKWIYAKALNGDSEANFKGLSKTTLGTIIKRLKESEKKNKKTKFHEEDLELLEDITIIRNFWAHHGYERFIYSEGDEFVKRFNRQFNLLIKAIGTLNTISELTEDYRYEIYNN